MSKDSGTKGATETPIEVPKDEVEANKQAEKDYKQQTKDAGIEKEVGDTKVEVADVRELTQLNAIPTRVTAVDPQGVERIIVPTRDPWTPREVDPDPVEVARVEARQKHLDAKREARLAQLKG